MTTDPVIDLKHVAKRYGRKVEALRGIAMTVRRGEVFGLLGPNGAGKSTLVKILMTVVRPTRAVGQLLGAPVGHKPTLRRVGYLPEQPRFPPYLTGRQALEFYAALANVDRPARIGRAGELLERLGLTAAAGRRVSTYSKGMLQRLGIAQALMHQPDLVLLDEPTDGLDPLGRRDVRDLVRQLVAAGQTVFLNSHLLGEVESVCDRVAILAAGSVVHQGTVADLTARSAYYEIELDRAPGVELLAAVRAAMPAVGDLVTARYTGRGASGAVHVAVVRHVGTLRTAMPAVGLASGGSVLRLQTAEAATVQPALDVLRSRGQTIRALRPARQSLEDFFVATVGPGGQAAGRQGVPA